MPISIHLSILNAIKLTSVNDTIYTSVNGRLNQENPNGNDAFNGIFHDPEFHDPE